MSIRSFGRNNDTIQNNRDAPTARKQNNPSGDIKARFDKSLHTMILKPKMEYATKHAICPINLLLSLNISIIPVINVSNLKNKAQKYK